MKNNLIDNVHLKQYNIDLEFWILALDVKKAMNYQSSLFNDKIGNKLILYNLVSIRQNTKVYRDDEWSGNSQIMTNSKERLNWTNVNCTRVKSEGYSTHFVNFKENKYVSYD